MWSSRRIIALVAAYAIALQALLAGGAAVTHAVAAASLGIVCAHGDPGSPGGGHAPAQDGCPCGPACIMADHALAFAVFDGPSAAVAWTAGKGEMVAPIDRAAAAIPDPDVRAHLPRAPPTA